MDPRDSSGPIIGIDLGTTYSAIAFLNGFGRAEVIPNAHGEQLIPSVVLFPPGERPVVGKEAKLRSAEFPERLAEFVKREMGDPDWRLRLDGEELTPPAISAVILGELLDVAEAKLGVRPTSAVITCPAYFGDLERQATADAGALAGLDVLSVFNEPTAAALSYGLHHAAKHDRVRALVYDLGGGTFDVTVLELEDRRVRVLATAGEHKLGGKDWDDELLNYVSEEFVVEHGQDPRDDESAQQQLRLVCEQAKIALSSKTKTDIVCQAFGKTHTIELTRALFDELTRSLLEQTRTYVEQVLEMARLGWTDLDVLLPVGGSSRMPQVRQLLEECSGRSPESVLNPDLAVAQGAAYYAALLRAEQGFEVNVLAATRAGDQVQPGALPETLEDAPLVLGALPGSVAQEEPLFSLGGAVGSAPPPAAPAPLPTVYAVPSLPGQKGTPKLAKSPAASSVLPELFGALPGRTAAPGAAPPKPAGGDVAGALGGRKAGATPPPKAPPAAAAARAGFFPSDDVELGALGGSVGGAEAPADWDPFSAGWDPTKSDKMPVPGFDPTRTMVHDQRDLDGMPAASDEAMAVSDAPPPGFDPTRTMVHDQSDLEALAAAFGYDATRTMMFDFTDIAQLGQEAAPTPGAPPQRAVTNVNSRPLGVLVFRQGRGHTSVMIEANTPLPATKRSKFVTINDNQTAVKIVVLEGFNPDPESNTRIGECVISGLPPRPKGQEIEILYQYDADGRIHIHARHVATDKRARAVLSRTTAVSGAEAERLAHVIDGFRV